MRTKKFVGYALVLLTSLTFFFLIFTSIFDARDDSDDVSIEDNFKELINSENSLVMFYSDERRGKALISEDDWNELKEYARRDFPEVQIAKFDCSIFAPICKGIGVQKYPSITWLKRGKVVDMFIGGTEIESIKTYVSKMVQTFKLEKKKKAKVTDQIKLDIDSADESDESSSETPTKEQHLMNEPKLADDIAKKRETTPTDVSKSEEVLKSESEPDQGGCNEAAEDDDGDNDDKDEEEEADDDDDSEKGNNIERIILVKDDGEVTIKDEVKSSEKKDDEDDESEDNDDDASKTTQKGSARKTTEASEEDDEENEEYEETENPNDFRIPLSNESSSEAPDFIDKINLTDISLSYEISSETKKKMKAMKKAENAVTTLAPGAHVIFKSSSTHGSFLELAANNFTAKVHKKGVAFVMLYAPWSHYCDEIRSVLKKLALKYKVNRQIMIGQINCINQANENLCQAQEMLGIPTLNVYRDGELLLNNFTGHTLAEIEDCLLSHRNDQELAKWQKRIAERERLAKLEGRKKKAAGIIS